MSSPASAGVVAQVVTGLSSVSPVSLAIDAGARETTSLFAADHLPRYSRVGMAGRRLLDLVGGTVGLLVAAVPAVAIAVAVKVTSRGPVLFVQERVGADGEPFEVYKFRTMRRGTHAEVLADPAERAAYEQNGFKLHPEDPRITRFGRWLRRTSLDELPQLLNVVHGDMSLVGVRPLVADELARRSTYDRALYGMLRPGMTGLWQVEGRSSLGTSDRLTLDRRYAEQWSLANDVRLLLRTPHAVLRIERAH